MLSYKGCALNVHGTSFSHPDSLQYWPSQTSESWYTHPPSLWCRRIDFFLASATRKEGARSDQLSVEDHVDVAVELALGRQHAPEVVPERVIWGR